MICWYIDPGTGSMLFSIFIGIVTTLAFVLRGQWIKIKLLLSGGKSKVDDKKIPLVIFSDSKRYWNVFKPICDELEKRNIQTVYYTASPDDPILSAKYEYIKGEFIGEGNKAFARLNMMRAKVCLSTTPGLDVLQWKRSKDVDYYVHVFHSIDDGLRYRMFGLDYYDAILMTGDFQEKFIRILEEKRNLKAKELVTVGCTYIDELKKRADATKSYTSVNVNNVEAMGGDEDSECSMNKIPTVLVAPTWGETSILNKFGEKMLKALVATGYDIVVRPHPQSKTSDPELLEKLQKEFPDGEHFSWNYDNDNFEILSKSDIMITDFSGVMFDYALVFDRPLIYADTKYDPAPYDSAWVDGRGWMFEAVSKLGRELGEDDFDGFKKIIDEVMTSDIYAAGRKELRETAWQNRGNSAVSVADYLEKKLSESED